MLSKLIEMIYLQKKEQSKRTYYLNLTLNQHYTNNVASSLIPIKMKTPTTARSSASVNENYFFQPILPNEIMEVCRQCTLKSNSTIFNKFNRSTSIRSQKKRLIFY